MVFLSFELGKINAVNKGGIRAPWPRLSDEGCLLTGERKQKAGDCMWMNGSDER